MINSQLKKTMFIFGTLISGIGFGSSNNSINIMMNYDTATDDGVGEIVNDNDAVLVFLFLTTNYKL